MLNLPTGIRKSLVFQMAPLVHAELSKFNHRIPANPIIIITTCLDRMTISVMETAINMGPVFKTERTVTTPGTSRPTLFEECVGF